MSFRQDELQRLEELAISKWPSQADRRYPHVLAPELVLENLLEDVWASALAYFDKHDIAWWLSDDERTEREQLGITHRLPTGHLNSSQVAYVNHLEPARVDADVVLAVARNLEPRVAEVRDTGEGGYVVRVIESRGERRQLAGARLCGISSWAGRPRDRGWRRGRLRELFSCLRASGGHATCHCNGRRCDYERL
jgi:hypothetical protein